jgi:predicted  nucleic acid-binding Zn-ribbon protein
MVKELSEIEKALAEVIRSQIELEDEEKKILEKRITEADLQLAKITSKAMKEDLLTERERVDARIVELTHQRSFLEKEESRFAKTQG